MITVLLIIAMLITGFYAYMEHPKFGKSPSGERLKLIRNSPNYKDGKFQNLHHTPSLTEGYNMITVLYELLFKRRLGRIPQQPIPSVKTDLLNLAIDKDVLVWFGHSSYFIQLDGKKILVDPVFSGNASPIKGSNKSFEGSDRYTADDIPEIDYLFITHDHYDHVDYEPIIALKPKIKKIICGLGVGSHFEYWGFSLNDIIEKDLNQEIILDNGFIAYTATTRHFSGRTFKRNNTLWLSYILQTPTMKIYIGGDSGYDTHFTEIGDKYGPFDLALLDNGQYDPKWKYIHMLPGEVLQAAKDLKAKRLFPVHSSKFAMANHVWDEPLVEITELNNSVNIPLVTPLIGEVVNLKDEHQQFKQWWVGMS
jgi:L-ascorbate metabolism protein UlaG (beta-lactamase superfamily)